MPWELTIPHLYSLKLGEKALEDLSQMYVISAALCAIRWSKFLWYCVPSILSGEHHLEALVAALPGMADRLTNAHLRLM